MLQCTKVKFHMILHYPASIRLFGVVRNFVAESFEMAHKPSKAAAKRTNWQVCLYHVISHDIISRHMIYQGDISRQLLANLERRQAMSELALLSEGRFHRKPVTVNTLSGHHCKLVGAWFHAILVNDFMLSPPFQVIVADAAKRPNMRMFPECLANFFLGPAPNGRQWTPAEAVAATPFSV